MSSLARPCGHKRQRPSTNVDRLSNLPESVLSHILSFLPTKDTVAISLLSKRWKFLWTNIHNLVFINISHRFGRRCQTKDGNIKFARFVNKDLLSLNVQCIDKFSLMIEKSKYCEVYDVTTWITNAVTRKPRVLDLCFFGYDPSEAPSTLPCSLFTCKTLEVLKLDGVMNLNAPSMVCLPNLKTLHLNNVIFQCDESFRNLVSGYSSLENLYIYRGDYDNVVTFTTSSPTLRNLTVEFHQDNIPFPEELDDYKLEINAPALRYLNLSDTMSMDFSFENLYSLEKATIYTEVIKDEENVPLIGYDEYFKAVVKLLQGVHNVKYLSLRDDALEALSHAGASPSFLRLTRLTVAAKSCHLNTLLKLVGGLHKLESVTLSKKLNHKDSYVKCWSKLEKVPICLFSCLKTILMRGFKGLEDELAMVAYILKNAKVLRTMTIDGAYNLDHETRYQLLKKVSKFFQGSEECEITLY